MRNAKQTSWLIVLLVAAMLICLVPAIGAANHMEDANYGFIPNSGEASVSKVDLVSATEVARYYTAPRESPDPYNWRTSRIAMDAWGNAWVINTGVDGINLIGAIVRIQADTTGLTNTHAYPDPVLDFGTDEAVQVLPVGNPGEMPRAIAIDSDGYIWVGFYGSGRLVKYAYDASVPGLVQSGEWTNPGIGFYEMKFAPDGTLFISSRQSTSAAPRPGIVTGIYTFNGSTFVRETTWNSPYSILIADDGTVYATAYTNLLWIRNKDTGVWSSKIITGSSQNRGMAFDGLGRIWIASTVGTSGGTVVYSYDISGGVAGPTYTLTSGTTPVGVGRDAAGNMWAVCRSDGMSQGWIEGFNPATLAKVGAIQVGYRPYAYGDFVVSTPPSENLLVTKTAVTSYTRTHIWSIDKSVDTEDGYEHGGYPKIWLYTDGSGDETATWTVDVAYEGYEDSGFSVIGAITIENIGESDAVITGIEDLLAGTPIDLDCGVTFPYTLGVGETLTCTYSEEGYVEGSNKVTVTTERDVYEASEDIVWGDPSNEVGATVTITDISDLYGEVTLGTATAPYNSQFTYSRAFAWEDYGRDGCGDYTYDNTATIVETGQSADATLKVNVQCYMYETAYARGDDAVCFIPTFANWGWTNPIEPGTYTWELWAAAGQCDTTKGTLVGSVIVLYGADGYVTVTYTVDEPFILEETHVYAGYAMFPKDRKGKPTVAPGQYYNDSPFDGSEVYVIAHAVVGIPDPDFGP